ncbi:hypothetical protein C2S53_016916 [Perilla frutescens var. hirtella]|uniref:DUF4283 domain-containing protein n=1 Tax=Perilla frutescens var. hirtella TaxID=608512 RepID=A0AAD4J3X0_PERFH|nr:hypothetical protein C2S53_016916 [Perilla frutescens var. hirtella]
MTVDVLSSFFVGSDFSPLAADCSKVPPVSMSLSSCAAFILPSSLDGALLIKSPDVPTSSYAKVTVSGLKPVDVFICLRNSIELIRKGDFFSVSIPDELYASQLLKFQFSLIGHLLLSKGDSPWQVKDLQRELSQILVLLAPWRLVSIGKCFFTLQFTSEVDQLKVWVRFFNLPYEYWHHHVITGIAKAVGLPLKIDSSTGKTSFFVDISYENLHQLCVACRQIGYVASNCRVTKSAMPKNDMPGATASSKKAVENLISVVTMYAPSMPAKIHSLPEENAVISKVATIDSDVGLYDKEVVVVGGVQLSTQSATLQAAHDVSLSTSNQFLALQGLTEVENEMVASAPNGGVQSKAVVQIMVDKGSVENATMAYDDEKVLQQERIAEGQLQSEGSIESVVSDHDGGAAHEDDL